MGMFYGHNQVKREPLSGLGYGLLYNWYAASDTKFAPTDWKVPLATEYVTLVNYIGGIAGGAAILKEEGTTHWYTSGNTNDYSFTSLGTGWRNSSGVFDFIKEQGTLWTSQSYTSTNAYTLEIQDAATNLAYFNRNKKFGLPVRLLYTGADTPTTLTDYDGNVYDTVVIGTQRWIIQNWKCTKLNDGTEIPEVTNNTTWAGLTSGALCAYDNDWNYV